MTQEPQAPYWNTIAIYGVGLIGGSIGMALRSRQRCARVVGIGRNADRLQKAVALGAIDEFVIDPAKSPPPDVVVLCAPVQLLMEHCSAVFECFPDALITDGGSTKSSLVRSVEQQLPQARFVGSHPLAGSDQSGVEHSTADLYEDRLVVVTPTEKTAAEDLAQVTSFWQAIGARTVPMDPETHDAALAITSHVPHVLAAALASATPETYLNLVAGGWRDMTRIAAADVELWRQILQDNQQNVLEQLQDVRRTIQEFETALSSNDQASLMRLLTAGKQRRDALGN